MPYFHMPKKPWVSDSPVVRGNKTVQDRKHTVLVDAADKSPRRLVETEAGTIQFVDGTAILPDDARGRDIAQEYVAKAPKKTVAVRDHRVSKYRGDGHVYFFTVPELPWKKGQESEDVQS